MLKDFKFEKQLQEIIQEYKEYTDEPLDGDEIDMLVYILWCKINLMEGNITLDEYEKYLDKGKFRIIIGGAL